MPAPTPQSQPDPASSPAAPPVTPPPQPLSVLLHRLRSPLTAIGGFAESLALQSRRGTLTEERLLDRLGRIRAAAERIDVLLDDLEATLTDEDTAGR